MSHSRYWLWGILAVAAIGVILFRYSVSSSSPQQETTRIVFVTGGTNPFWQLIIKGAQAAAKEYDAELAVRAPQQENLAEQNKIIMNVDTTGIDGLALSPLDAEAQTRAINRLSEDIDVVTFDSDAELSNRRLYIGTSNLVAGRQCAEVVSEMLPDGGEVAVLIVNQTKSNAIDRKRGFEEASGNSIKIIDVLEDGGDTAVCEQNIRKVLEEHPNVAGFVGFHAYHGPILLDVLRQENTLDKVKIVAFDEDEATLQGVADGHIYATIVQDPFMYGYEAVRLLTKLKHSNKAGLPISSYGTVNFPCEVIRQEDVDGFRNRLEQRLNSNPEEAGQAEKPASTTTASAEAHGQTRDKSELDCSHRGQGQQSASWTTGTHLGVFVSQLPLRA